MGSCPEVGAASRPRAAAQNTAVQEGPMVVVPGGAATKAQGAQSLSFLPSPSHPATHPGRDGRGPPEQLLDTRQLREELRVEAAPCGRGGREGGGGA